MQISEETILCVVGLGYVGLPLTMEFARSLKVIGFDSDAEKIQKLKQGSPAQNIIFTDDPREIGRADFVIIAVPTPLTAAKTPDLSCVIDAARLVSRNLKRGSIVILESTVYPGTTEEVVKPLLEESGLKCGEDFKLAYSPERINPGDDEHTLRRVTKIVSGMDPETTEIVAQLYRRVAPQVFPAKNMKTAEAAKVVENVQRDLNIALMNELSLIFEKMGLNTREVLEAAATKWNFHRYSPGLVGGRCIPIAPYYLIHKAEVLGYRPQLILAGRAVNEYMPRHVAWRVIAALNRIKREVQKPTVLIMGLSYKENIPDVRGSGVKQLIEELKGQGIKVYGYDPVAHNVKEELEVERVDSLDKIKVDAIVLATAHDAFRELTLEQLREITRDRPILMDIKGFFDAAEAKSKGFHYESL